MGRERASKVTFGLEPDDEHAHQTRAEDAVEPDPGWARAPADAAAHLLTTLHSWPRGRRVAVAGALALLLAGGAAVAVVIDGARERALAERLATAPGGVVGLEDPPVERWRVALDQPWPVAVVAGALVVASEDDAGVTLRALDPDDGAELWATDLGAHGRCGGATGLRQPGADVGVTRDLVCLRGDSSAVAVVDASGGLVAERPVADRADDELVFPAPDSALLRIARLAPPAPEPRFEAETLLDPLVTRPARVRLEDARTGAARWEVELPAATLAAGARVGSLQACMATTGVGETPRVDPAQGWSYELDEDRVWVSGCGADAVLDLATGAVLLTRDPFDPQTRPWEPSAVSLDGDGYATAVPPGDPPGGAAGATRVWSDDGTVVGEVHGTVMLPLATDGTDPEVLFALGPHGLTAHDPADLSERWSRDPARSGRVLLRTHREAVVASGSDVVAVDPRTGATRWTNPLWRPLPGAPSDAHGGVHGGPGSVVDVFTDGHRVVLVQQVGMDDAYGVTEVRLDALDLRAGDVSWTWSTLVAPQAIDGRLYTFGFDGVVALGG